MGLGFRTEDWHRQTDEFSGGWQMRIALAKLLLQKPNLLLLDEPTNHLDLESRNWLEQYLTHYPNALVLISHDRYFLDVTVNKLSRSGTSGSIFISGNYEKYLAAEDAAQSNWRRHIATSVSALSSWKYLSIASATRHESEAGAKPDQRTGKDRAHPIAGRGKDDPFFFSAAETERPDRGGVYRRWRNPMVRRKYFAM